VAAFFETWPALFNEYGGVVLFWFLVAGLPVALWASVRHLWKAARQGTLSKSLQAAAFYAVVVGVAVVVALIVEALGLAPLLEPWVALAGLTALFLAVMVALRKGFGVRLPEVPLPSFAGWDQAFKNFIVERPFFSGLFVGPAIVVSLLAVLCGADWLLVGEQEARGLWSSWNWLAVAASPVSAIALWWAARTGRNAAPRPTSHGSARWANAFDVEAHERMSLGTLVWAKSLYLGITRGRKREALRFKGDGHVLTVGGSGVGKGVGVVIPNLLLYSGPIVCLDPKGENFKSTARYRAAQGQRVAVLDPWNIVDEVPGCDFLRVNPLSVIVAQSEKLGPDHLTDGAAWVAEALVMRGGETDSYWNDQAEDLLQGLILHAMTGEPEERRNLLRVRHYLNLPPDAWRFLLEEQMGHSTAAGGRVANAAFRQLQRTINSDREAQGIMSTAQRHTHFLEVPALVKMLEGHTPRFAEAAFEFEGKPITWYLCIPPQQIERCAGWIRLIVSMLLRMMLEGKQKPKDEVVFLLDEFAALGGLKIAARAMAEARGYNVKLWPIVQDLSQLKANYGERWETFIGNAAAVQAFFGQSDQFTCEYVSKMTGTATVATASGSTGSSENDRGGSSSTSSSWGLTGRRLLMPDEIRSGRTGSVVVLARGLQPCVAEAVPYFKLNKFKGKVGEVG
jgi:type IV secretion system protein VirD4